MRRRMLTSKPQPLLPLTMLSLFLNWFMMMRLTLSSTLVWRNTRMTQELERQDSFCTGLPQPHTPPLPPTQELLPWPPWSAPHHHSPFPHVDKMFLNLMIFWNSLQLPFYWSKCIHSYNTQIVDQNIICFLFDVLYMEDEIELINSNSCQKLKWQHAFCIEGDMVWTSTLNYVKFANWPQSVFHSQVDIFRLQEIDKYLVHIRSRW